MTLASWEALVSAARADSAGPQRSVCEVVEPLYSNAPRAPLPNYPPRDRGWSSSRYHRGFASTITQ